MSVATILIALIVVAVILLGIIITVIVKSRKVKPEDGYEDEYDDDDYDDEEDDDEEEEEVQRPRRRRPVRQDDETAPIPVQEPKKKKTKKQWKIIMENLETWEKYTFVFYDNIGIGRGTKTSEFEKYISINDDPRVSKLHCAIIHEGDRLYLKDMDSRNGTYLNGQLLEEPVAIQKEDVIGLGKTKIEVKKILRERD